MKFKLTIATVLSLMFGTIVAQTVVQPSVKSPTSFAIIIDSKSYEKAENEVQAYRNVIEEDKLGTYIIIDNWKSPDDIKKILIDLHNNKKQPLEGTVFVGDIPIPMLRDAQHLTSAFKMIQDRYPWQRSSVPSDRFYDNFDLKFDFLKQDEDSAKYFYYTLRGDGAQKLKSDIYSARIMPYSNEKADKYTHLKNYLNKVVNERRNNTNNVVNKLSMARGHGYNSESKVSWAAEQIALKEQFPALYSSRGVVKFIDFASKWPAKEYFMNEVQRADLDIMLFHHHGGQQAQYLNGLKEASDHNTSKDNIKRYARSKIRSAARKSSKEEAMQHYMNFLDIPRSWIEDTFDPEVIRQDSLYDISLDIDINDIKAMKPQAKFVMFDACYNGSFYVVDNVANEYIFNDGKTIVTQGNTVNVIQDKWPDEFLGLLAAGLRVGALNQHTNYLESHLIGDPTYRFANNSDIAFDINTAIQTRNNNNKFWLKQLKHKNVDLQSMALRKLYDNNYSDISNLLKESYLTSKSMIVRAEAFFLLSKLNDSNFLDILPAAAYDSYELIRRFAAQYMGKNGADVLIPAFVESYFWDSTSERVQYNFTSFLGLFNLDKMESFVKENKSRFGEENVEDLLKLIQIQKESFERKMHTILSNDTTIKEKDRVFDVRRFRNHPDSKAVSEFITLAKSESENEELRLLTIEALGWYNFSHRKQEIIEGLTPLTHNNNKAIRNEAQKTVNRLK